MTKYAKTMLELIENSRSHMTAEQVFHALRQVYPKVALATVYNNLNRLWEEGRIRKVSIEGMPDRYDRIQRHDHLVCQGCGKLVDIDLGGFDSAFTDPGGCAHSGLRPEADVSVPRVPQSESGTGDNGLSLLCRLAQKKQNRSREGKILFPSGSFYP